MSKFNVNQAIGDIVSLMPKAGEVFKKYGIDFCCGGNRPLSEAITEQNLKEEEVLESLDIAYEETRKTAGFQQVDFLAMKDSSLIDHIVNTHHAYLNGALPETAELAATILKVHGANHKELFKVHKLFNSLKSELEQHLIKEEAILFPMLKEYEESPSENLLNEIKQVTVEIEDEHEGAGDILKELRKVTEDYRVPDDGCRTFHRTYEMMKEIESDLFQHIHLENNILFKRHGISL